MEICVHLWQYVAEIILESEQTKSCRKNRNAHFMLNIFFPVRKACRFRDNVEKYYRAQKTTYKRQSIYYLTYLKDIIWKLLQKKTKVVGTDHLRTKIIINDETIEQVSQFTYLGCSVSYQISNDVEFKLAKFSQLIGTIKRTIFKKVRTETILKIYNTLVLPTFLYGSEKWTLTALQRRRLKRQKWSYWDFWQATPFMTTKQMITYAANYGLQAY